MTRLFLGVDGGQSSTTALIGDERGRVLGEGRGGPCNHVGAAEGHRKFVAAMETCLREACRAAGLDLRAACFEAACLGFSGGPADKEAILRGMLPADRLVVTNDAEIALAGATAGDPGIIVIAGTGSIAFGRNAAGATARAGGWGYIFGDEGGAFDIVRRALRAALRYEEGWGLPTRLHAALLEATGASGANDLLHRFYTDEYPRSRVAQLAKLVDETALAGDPIARESLEGAATALSALADAVRRRLFEEGVRVRVAYSGGVFESRLMLGCFRDRVERLPGAFCSPPLLGPAAGALLEAYRAAGLRPALAARHPQAG